MTLSKWLISAAAAAVALCVSSRLNAQAAPGHLTTERAAASTAKPPLKRCLPPLVYDSRLGRCAKSSVVTAATDQVPQGHREETVTVLKSTWQQMGDDLKKAAERIRELREQAARLRKELDDLKKAPGCGGG